MRHSIVSFLLPLALATATAGQTRSPAGDKQLTVADLVGRTSGAVVQIVTSDSAGKELALGSGFLISPDGKIVTNYHVIKGAHSAVVKLSDGAFFPVAGVWAVDATLDIAILRVNGAGLPFLRWAPSDNLRVGDHVVAIGSPLGLEGTVSDGIISALRAESPGENWIQTTAPVSHGNSGGPLLDMKGGVVGMITWGVNLQEGQNLNFAIPSDEIMPLLASGHQQLSLDAVQGLETPGVASTTTGSTVDDAQKADSLVAEGHKSVASKEYERAIHDFEEALRINKENPAAWNGLGIAHSLLDQHDEAIADFKQAVNYAPNWEECWVSLGVEYLIVNKPNDALEALQQAVGLKATDATAWLYLGKVYAVLHNDEQATRCFKQATVIEPNNAEAWYELGQALDSSDTEKIAALTKAVQLKPDYVEAWSSLALNLNSAKRYDDAIAAWNRRLALKSTDAYLTDARVYSFIGADYESEGKLKEAETAYLDALNRLQSQPYATNNDRLLINSVLESLYLLYDKMGNHKQAAHYRQAWLYLAQHPN